MNRSGPGFRSPPISTTQNGPPSGGPFCYPRYAQFGVRRWCRVLLLDLHDGDNLGLALAAAVRRRLAVFGFGNIG